MSVILTIQLWFDVEERYNTTDTACVQADRVLWFDVEERYNTTLRLNQLMSIGCGLM